ncbi:hypothetical protein PybrP1_010568, partial [[Pythium] brassicae (nom. inval.)]
AEVHAQLDHVGAPEEARVRARATRGATRAHDKEARAASHYIAINAIAEQHDNVQQGSLMHSHARFEYLNYDTLQRDGARPCSASH